MVPRNNAFFQVNEHSLFAVVPLPACPPPSPPHPSLSSLSPSRPTHLPPPPPPRYRVTPDFAKVNVAFSVTPKHSRHQRACPQLTIHRTWPLANVHHGSPVLVSGLRWLPLLRDGTWLDRVSVTLHRRARSVNRWTQRSLACGAGKRLASMLNIKSDRMRRRASRARRLLSVRRTPHLL